MNIFDTYLESSWKALLKDEIQQKNILEINDRLIDYSNKGEIIYPKDKLIFNAFNHSTVSKTKVIILGQDPYHQPNQAMGLSFSVPSNIKTPPSLKNIYKEINDDIGGKIPSHGDLSNWAKQGILLLNSILTVSAGKPGSHKNIGWQKFTDVVIQNLSNQKSHLVFLLWGNYAKRKADLIDSKKHLILTSSHPSPLARGGFFGNKHFSKTNEYLKLHNLEPIQWLPTQITSTLF